MITPVATSLLSFFSNYSHVMFHQGHVLIRAGEIPGGIYYLLHGVVRQYAISSKGEALMIHAFRPAAFFPMLWALTGRQNTHQYEAVTGVEAFRAPKEAVNDFLSKHPEEMETFTRRLLVGVGGLLTRIEHLVFDGAYRKTILLLCYYGRQFGRQDDGVTVIPMPLSHREIASWIGTTRETVSIQMELLQKKGLIACRGRQLVIKSLAALEEEASGIPCENPPRDFQ